MGETIPKETNYVALDKEKKDEWGIPLLKISIDYDENDEKMIVNFFKNKFRKKINKNYFLNLNLNNARWKKII
jgi:hypothetical protein